MKTFAAVTVAAVAGFVALKALLALLLPLFGLFFGLVVLAFKLAVVGAIIAFVWSAIRRGRRRSVA